MVNFERLVSRNVARFISDEIDLAGIKTTVERFLGIAIVGGLLILAVSAFAIFLLFKINPGIAGLAGIAFAVLYEVSLYGILEFMIEKRKNFAETVLPDYLQLTAANIRSGIALDKAMLSAARPEFGYFSDDVKLMEARLYAGDTLPGGLRFLAGRYRSPQLARTMRMIIESVQYGGGMTDMLNQISKDLRSQATIQKEIAGQLFMYTIFISFAALVGAPVLYALTDKMITVTSTIWTTISKESAGNFTASAGLSFLKPSPPKITPAQYNLFAYAAIIVITGLGAFITSVISSGSVVRGLRMLPVFILIGLVVFYITSFVIGGIFNTISLGAGAGAP